MKSPMKYVSVLMAGVFALFVASCSKRSYSVDAAGNTNVDASNYNTYGFASQVDNKLDEGFFFLNDLVMKAEIRDAVMHEMNARGYTYSANAPDLIVNFRVFEKAADIQTADNLGNSYWANGEINGYYNAQPIHLQPGSIMVHLVDRKTGALMWQGYASGLTDGYVLNKQNDKIDQAVSLVFDQFSFRADNL